MMKQKYLSCVLICGLLSMPVYTRTELSPMKEAATCSIALGIGLLITCGITAVAQKVFDYKDYLERASISDQEEIVDQDATPN